ncbi:MAG: hypothetical protein HeimC2_00390 [Candidatus Heimdallarchaeota archaeon LC_2]|nr:MAG: hypothetical protein HeimC2_00390 [Candidatus Heimdallarchaeota archaeon LC_2]
MVMVCHYFATVAKEDKNDRPIFIENITLYKHVSERLLSLYIKSIQIKLGILMTISDKKDDIWYLFVDAKPNEVFSLGEIDETPFIIAAISTDDYPKFDWLKQYKNTRGPERKITTIRKLQQTIFSESKPTFVKLIAENTRKGVYEYGEEKLNLILTQDNSEINEKDDKIYYKLNDVDKQLSKSKFTTLCGFGASLLSMLQEIFEKNVQVQNYSKTFFVIDNLPHEDLSINMWKTLKLIIETISHLYNIPANISGLGPIEHGIKDGKKVGPKEITQMNLADWFAAIHYHDKSIGGDINAELKKVCSKFVHGQIV